MWPVAEMSIWSTKCLALGAACVALTEGACAAPLALWLSGGDVALAGAVAVDSLSGIALSAAGGGAAAAITEESAASAATRAVPIGPVPARAWGVLSRIDAEASALPGFEGGTVFRNRESLLPSVDSRGASIAYREWDVHPYVEGVNRGGERLVTGSDGSAYFTTDHYKTFITVRGARG